MRAIALLLAPALPAAALLGVCAPASATAVGSLAAELERAPEAERVLILRALGGTGKKAAAEPLLKAFAAQAGRPELAAAAAAALGQVGDLEAADELLRGWERLMDLRFSRGSLPPEVHRLRAAIAEALGKLGDIKALPALRRGMIDEDPLVARRSVEALGRLRDRHSVEWIARLASGPDEETSALAYEALGAIGNDKATEVLRSALESGGPRLRVLAAYGLARAKEKVGLLRLEGFLEEVEGEYPEGVLAAYYLTRLGETQGLDYLVRILENPKSRFRAAAASALGQSGDSRAALPLSERAGDPDPELRLRVAEALGVLGGGRARGALKKLKSDSSPAVRAAARAALADMGEYEPP